jgi:enhancing lycopene biosynthesis protein 2
MKQMAILLNGAGHRDGSEIHEAVCTILAVEELGMSWECLALDRDQSTVFNHVSGKEVSTSRNMLEESARIARGKIRDLTKVKPEDYGAFIIPGGFGTARNLCNFAMAGAGMEVDREVEAWLKEAHSKRLPIGAICIAPIILAKVFGELKPRLTFGSVDNDAAKAARSWGVDVVECGPELCVSDDRLRLVSTPAYMHDTSALAISKGIKALVSKLQSI